MKKILLFITIAIIILLSYNCYLNKNFKVKETQVNINDISENHDGLKIIQLSDFLIHDEDDLKTVEKIVLKVNELKPDIILFNGDLISIDNSLSLEDINTLKDTLNNLECTLYKYAVIGDNDNENLDTYKDILDSSNFILLNNKSTYLFYKDVKPIMITGLTNLDDLDNTFNIDEKYETSFNIVISHYPDYIDSLKDYDISIYYAGHSLNGLIKVPFGGGIIKDDNSSKYIDGYYNVNGTQLYISGGIGTHKNNIRIFNEPEINLYRISIE